jgi:hypothetical protein
VHVDADIWTEGKTDAQHLRRAADVLEVPFRLNFHEDGADMGDDKLLKQCQAYARSRQVRPHIFIFDRDKPDIVSRVESVGGGFKDWGNNVYSFSIPIPSHRPRVDGVCIELMYTDAELRTSDQRGRRLFLSSEFNERSGRHLLDKRLSVADKGRLRREAGQSLSVRIVDTDVFDHDSNSVALSKAEFTRNIFEGIGDFGLISSKPLEEIFTTIQAILDHSRPNVKNCRSNAARNHPRGSRDLG